MFKRLVRIVWRLVCVVALLAAAALAVVLFLLPPLAQQRVIQTLGDVGLDEAELRVDSIGVHRSSISNISLGPDDRVTIDHLTAEYDLRNLDDLELIVTGLRLRATLANNRFDLGPLFKLQLGGDGADTELPFAAVHLRASTLVLETPAHTYTVALHGTLRRADPHTLDVDITLGWLDQRLHLRGPIAFAGGNVESPDLQLTVEPTDVPLPGSTMTLRRTGADLHLSATLADQTLNVKVLESTTLNLDAVDFGDQTIALTPGALSGELTLRWGDEAGETLNGELSVHGASLTHDAANLHVPNVNVVLPIHFGPGRAEQGTVTTGQIKLGDDTLPPLEASIQLDETELTLAGDWPLLEAAPLHIDARLGAGGIRVDASTGPFTIVDPHAVGRRFAALADVELSGGFALQASMSPETGNQPVAKVTLDDATIRARSYDVTVEGVSGSVTLDRFAPPATPGSQTLTIDQLTTGKLELTDGRIAFRVESGRSVFIERVALTLGRSGRVEAHAFRYELDQPMVRTELYIEDLNLGDWLSVLSNEKIKATGQVYGRIPITFRPEARWKLSLGDGFLYTTPGPGQMRMPDSNIAGNLLDQADPRFRTDPELQAARDRIVSALTDFEYSMFRFNIQPEPDDEGMMLRIETRGKGRTGPNPQEIGGLVINVHNFDKLVNQTLLTQTRLNVDRALEQFFGGGGR